MTHRKKKWLLTIGGLALIALAVIYITATVMINRSEPYIRDQAVAYLSDRFDSDVQMEALRVHLPSLSPWQLIRGVSRGIIVRVEGEGISLRHKGRLDVPPLFTMNHLTFDVDLAALLDSPKIIPLVALEGVEINIPPKEKREEGESPEPSSAEDSSEDPAMNLDVIVNEVWVRNAKLNILPKDAGKNPLQFDIHQVRLETVGNAVAMKYEAALTNAKPPGEILSTGNIGPWSANEPGDTPLDGSYTFENADLGVFKGIAGILRSTGQFEGSLSAINVRGEADVPDFRLTMSGNPVPLSTKFEVLVDGTNGNTVLQPVIARLGSTDFTTSGALIKHEGDKRRTISLDVTMPKGNMADLLRLAMKGAPFMEGVVVLKTSIDIPPLSETVREKLKLKGTFQVAQGKFLKSTVQDKIDEMSRRGQGEPKNEAIDEVVSNMKGAFELENEVITFRSLSFNVPGAAVDLAGSYTFEGPLDFHGNLKLDAKVSQTMTGWKRWFLKPIDPFFAKNGAGTFVGIKVEGTAEKPEFGLDLGGGKDTPKPKA